MSDRSSLRAAAVAAATALVLLIAASSHTSAFSTNVVADRHASHAGLTAVPSTEQAPGSRSVAPDRSTSDFAVSPLVSPSVREFIMSKTDFARSALLGRIVVPLVLLVLIGRELLAAAGRRESRIFLAYGVPLISLLAMLAFVRLRAYLG